MSSPVFTRPEKRRPFREIGESIRQGIASGFERGGQLAQEEQQRSRKKLEEQQKSDILSQVLERAQRGEGDFLENLLGELSQSGLSIEDQQSFLKSVVPAQEQIRKGKKDALEQQSLEKLFGESPMAARSNQPLNEVGEEATVQTETFFDESNPPESPPKPTIQRLPDANLSMLAARGGKIGDAAKVELDRRKEENRRFESDRNFAREEAKDYVKTLTDQRRIVRNQDMALQNLQTAIEEGNDSGFNWNFIAQRFDAPFLFDAKGALLQNAAKDFLIGNINRITGRPNQWVEQQLADAIPSLGKSKYANLVQARSLQGNLDIARKEVELFDQLSKQYKERLGYIPGNIEQIVSEQLQPIARDIQDNMAFDMRRLFERDIGREKLSKKANEKVVKGTFLTPEMFRVYTDKNKGNTDEALKQAKRLGYTVPSQEQMTRWMQ